MKKLLSALVVSAAALFASTARAGVDQMVAQCEAVMACDLCKIALDQKVYTDETIEVQLKDFGKRKVLVSAYNWLREPQESVAPNGEHVMCQRVRQAMKEPWSNEGVAARSMFDAQWKTMDYCPWKKK